MSPILVRPVREQFEHDRVIRLLQAKARRRYEVAINPGAEQNVPVGTGPAAQYPDLVLLSQERGRRLQAVIEVETAESVNHLEAMAQWARLANLRAPLHLYVPAGSFDSARRFCIEHRIPVAEIWSYHSIGDQLRFTLAYRAPADSRPSRSRQSASPARKPVRSGSRAKPAPRSRAKAAPRKTARAQKRK